MYNTKERLVRREEASPPCECVSLQHTLAGMLREDFDYTSSAGTRILIPLEVTTSCVEHRIKLVRHKLVGRENAERARVPGHES